MDNNHNIEGDSYTKLSEVNSIITGRAPYN